MGWLGYSLLLFLKVRRLATGYRELFTRLQAHLQSSIGQRVYLFDTGDVDNRCSADPEEKLWVEHLFQLVE